MPTEDLTHRRQRTFRLEAVVLRHIDWGEADRMVWLYSLEKGKLCAIAKGVRKPRSRKAGHLEPIMRVSLLLARGRDLSLITQADTMDSYLPLHDDFKLSTYAFYVVELLDRFTYEEEENRALYCLLTDTFRRLCQPGDLDIVLRYYEVRLLDLVGFRPQLFQCAECRENILPQDQFFSAERGGALCPNCGHRISGSRPVSMTALKYLRHFQRSSFKEALRVKLPPALNREIENLMEHYLTYLLERSLNTPAFLRRVRRIEAQGEDVQDGNEVGEGEKE